MVAAFMVGLDDEIFVIDSGGTMIRMAVRDISSQGRDATGVRVMNLDEGQTVAAVAPVLQGDEEGRGPLGGGGGGGGGGAPPPFHRRCRIASVLLLALPPCRWTRAPEVGRGGAGRNVGRWRHCWRWLVVAVGGMCLQLGRMGGVANARAKAQVAADTAALAGAAEGEEAAEHLRRRTGPRSSTSPSGWQRGPGRGAHRRRRSGGPGPGRGAEGGTEQADGSGLVPELRAALARAAALHCCRGRSRRTVRSLADR